MSGGLAGVALACAAAENVALHKPYTLSPVPNYSYCTDVGDRVQLTDGEYVRGYFWTQKGTVGWTHAAPALVTIDLGRVEPIRGVSWSCAAGVAGVAWPECLYVLASDDRKSWTFLGDLCELGTVERTPQEKGYALFRYATDKLRGHGRYVCVAAAAQPYCFVDEIVAWALAIRAAKLGVTLFEDPTYTDPTKGDPEMFAASDVLCPNTPMMVAQGEPFRAFYQRQREVGKTLWLYSCSGPAKLLDPIAYHRVQAWLAFQMGAEGSFYWAFGCGGGIGDSWRADEQVYNEYSPYFVGPDGVMEGKHSEAVREGVQDYEYLRMLSEAAQRARTAGGGAAWLPRAEAVLGEGVAQAVAVASPSNLFWRVEKDRTAMDAVRVRVLDVLEEIKEKGR